MRPTRDSGAPNINVKVPAVAPTTPPDMGASTKLPWLSGSAEDTAAATSRDEEGSMVEQSMKSRCLGLPGRPPLRMASYVDLTCCGSGRQVMTVSFDQHQLARQALSFLGCPLQRKKKK